MPRLPSRAAARRREMARFTALRTLFACLLLRAAPPARAAAGAAGGIGALSLPQSGAAALRVYLAGDGAHVCYSLSNPDDTAWVGQSGCVAAGLSTTAPATTCQALQLGAAAPPPNSRPPLLPSPPLPVRSLARGRRAAFRLVYDPIAPIHFIFSYICFSLLLVRAEPADSTPKPAASEPVGKPTTPKSTTAKPAAPQPAAPQPAAAQSAAAQSTAPEPATESAAAEPSAEPSAAESASEPSAAKPAAPQPATT